LWWIVSWVRQLKEEMRRRGEEEKRRKGEK
jgi:hypothetical protein